MSARLESAAAAKGAVETRFQELDAKHAALAARSAARDAEVARLSADLAAAQATGQDAGRTVQQAEEARARVKAELDEQRRVVADLRQKLAAAIGRQQETQAAWELRMSEAGTLHAREVQELKTKIAERAGKKDRALAATKDAEEAKIRTLSEPLEGTRKEVERRQRELRCAMEAQQRALVNRVATARERLRPGIIAATPITSSAIPPAPGGVAIPR